MSYLCVKQDSANTRSYSTTSATPNAPYMVVKGYGSIPLTTETSTNRDVYVKANNTSYRLAEIYSTSQASYGEDKITALEGCHCTIQLKSSGKTTRNKASTTVGTLSSYMTVSFSISHSNSMVGNTNTNYGPVIKISISQSITNTSNTWALNFGSKEVTCKYISSKNNMYYSGTVTFNTTRKGATSSLTYYSGTMSALKRSIRVSFIDSQTISYPPIDFPNKYDTNQTIYRLKPESYVLGNTTYGTSFLKVFTGSGSSSTTMITLNHRLNYYVYNAYLTSMQSTK